MPKKKQEKQTDEWDVMLDGKRVGSAPTEATANALMREFAKTLPSGFSFTFNVAKSESAHRTTA